MGSDLDESISLKFEDDPVMSAAISAATSGHLMDISDMMQDQHSDKASEHNYDDIQQDNKINSNNYNGGEKHSPIHHQSHTGSKHIERNVSSTGNGGGNGNHGGRESVNMTNNVLNNMTAGNDYDDSNDVGPPMAHTPVYMPQHHNIDQVSSRRFAFLSF